MKPDISGQDFSCWASRWNPKMYILRKIFMINSILTGPQGWMDGPMTDLQPSLNFKNMNTIIFSFYGFGKLQQWPCG